VGRKPRKRTGPRPVDAAMRAERPEKTTVRRIWIDKLGPYHDECPEDGLLYVFLPGAEGYEIELLAQNNFIQLTETGGIAQTSMLRIAAIESNKLAVAALQKKFPGLKIYETNFQGLIRGDGLLSYPDGEHRQCCRARVLNLDLNEVLLVQGDEYSFPIFRWIQKLGEIHSVAPRLDWCLYLTLHGEIKWDQNISSIVRQFLSENFNRAGDFSLRSRNILGDEVFSRISEGEEIDFSRLDRELQQKLLMLFVPKKIADIVRAQMWRLETEVNLRYGQPGHAPMVTWVIHFKHDPRAAATPDAVYLQGVNRVLEFAGQIDAKGEVIFDGQ
jgi:hypothetical protein